MGIAGTDVAKESNPPAVDEAARVEVAQVGLHWQRTRGLFTARWARDFF